MSYLTLFVTSLICAVLLPPSGFAQDLPVSLRVMNIRAIDSTGYDAGKPRQPNTLVFDVYLKNKSKEAILYAMGQYYFQMERKVFNEGIPSFWLIESGLPEKLRFAEVEAYRVGDSIQLCCPVKAPRDRIREFKIQAGDSVLIGRFAVKTDWLTGFRGKYRNIKIRTYANSGFPFTKFGVYYKNKVADVWKTCEYFSGE